MMRLDATRYLRPYYRRHIVHDPVSLTVSDHTYSADEALEKSWLPITFRAFSVIASKLQVRDVLIIGTGIGLDALGVLEIYDLHSLTLTDISTEVLSVAKENINANIDAQAAPTLHFYVGDMLSCVPAEQQYDLVVENLPTVPAPPQIDIREADNSAYYFDTQGRKVPEILEHHLLASHYQCLQDAYKQVRPKGGVLTCIGGRAPFELVLDMHRVCGYTPELVAFDLKIQGEPERMLASHRAAEEAFGVAFKFYERDALNIVATHRALGLEGQQLFEAVRGQIEGYALSTQEALAQVHRGKDVAHLVLMVFGQRLDP